MLRQDSFMLEMCKFRLHDLLTDGKVTEEIRDEAVKYLDIAKAHTPRSDWADNLFIGTVYFALGEKDIIPLRMLANIIATTDGAKTIVNREK